MSTIVFRCDVTWTTTGSGGYTKSTLPATAAGGSARTIDISSTVADPALQAIFEDFRRKIVQCVQALDPNANANVTITTKSVT